jgi:membrane protein DedA with SNARE-associated domain
MWELILKILTVYFSSMLKFIFGPLGGKAAGLNIFLTMTLTVAGMMTVVAALANFGNFFRRRILSRFRRKKTSDQQVKPKKSNFVKKYGLAGIAFLTPLILTPIGGTLLAISVVNSKPKVIAFMLASAAFWSVIMTLAVYLGVDLIVNWVRQFSDY